MYRIAIPLTFSLIAASCANDKTAVESCDDALSQLATCNGTDADGPHCQDTSAPAVYAAANCQGAAGKADSFGSRGWGEACRFNWQCDGSADLSCNHGKCYANAGDGQACDRKDHNDCLGQFKCADDLSVPSKPDGVCKLKSTPVAPALYAETIAPNETEGFEQQTADLMGIQMRAAMARLNGDDEIRRVFHPKKHLCAVGSFEAAATGALATGPLFGRTQTLPAYVRLSLGSLTMTPDKDSGIQGLAIKVIGVPGPKVLSSTAVTQDFLMINIPANVTTNSAEFVELAKAQEKGGATLAHFLLTHPRIAARAAKIAQTKYDSVRTLRYWAANANRHGQIAVKYSARPCANTPAGHTSQGDNFLREDVKRQLANGEICFDFYAQPQTDAVAMSIEDSTAVWDETASVPVRIGRLVVPRTALDTPAANAVEATCDGLAFNPWNTAPEYKPLGNVNRGRKFAYEGSQRMRGAKPEPTTTP